MRSIRRGLLIATWAAAAALSAATGPSDTAARTELKRADLSGAPGMEVITSVSEYRTGEGIARHIHHGVETGYVLQGSMVQYPGQAPTLLATGTPVMNLRDVPHAGFRVVGAQPLRLLTVHVVDKDKPLYDWVK
ncbi:MAG TPA: cupin domain-containing protein [Steroidobacteraceae bacterium]|nr:cupin domain-containing protein [Steroidobacteraceae bacterium]